MATNKDGLAEGLAAAFVALDRKLPAEVSWTPEFREKWMKAFVAFVDLRVSLVEEQSGDEPVEAKDAGMEGGSGG